MSIERLEALYKNAFADLSNIKFDKQHPWHRGLVLLYLSIVEYSDTFLGLHLISKPVAMPVVCRGLLEAYIDFKNLHTDPKYGYCMEAAQLKDRLRVLRDAQKTNNPYLDGVEDFYDKENEWESELKFLKSQGYESLPPYKKFKLAGKVDEYQSIYSQLCSHSHNDISALTERYIDLKENKIDYEVSVFNKYEPENYLHLIDLVFICLSDSSARLHKTLNSNLEVGVSVGT